MEYKQVGVNKKLISHFMIYIVIQQVFETNEIKSVASIYYRTGEVLVN